MQCDVPGTIPLILDQPRDRASRFEELPVQAQDIIFLGDSIHAVSPATKIYVRSVLPRGAEYRERIEALNALLEQSVAGSATWINVYPLFLDTADGSIRNDLGNDELHSMGAGSPALARRDQCAGAPVKARYYRPRCAGRQRQA